jgi:hypothetical protein
MVAKFSAILRVLGFPPSGFRGERQIGVGWSAKQGGRGGGVEKYKGYVWFITQASPAKKKMVAYLCSTLCLLTKTWLPMNLPPPLADSCQIIGQARVHNFLAK